MKILVAASNHPLRNVGDVAMRIVSVRRLHEFLPEAKIIVVTADLDLFQTHFPGETPLSCEGEKAMMKSRLVPIRTKWLPSGIGKQVDSFECTMRERFPRLAYKMAGVLAPLNGINRKELDGFMSEVLDCDAVVMAGGGFITDAFPGSIRTIVGFTRLVQRLGKPTAMFGQGLGPLNNPELQKRVAPVLADLDLLTLREKKEGLPLLKTLGVPLTRTEITGDDAIIMGYEERRDALGKNLGFNLRVADYSGFPTDAIANLREAVSACLKKFSTSIVPLPVYTRPGDEDDHRSIEQVCRGLPLIPPIENRVVTALDLIRRAGDCRVVVTGSYHAGVFALAQGIPVIGLAKSPYYVAKFEGLAEQFPGGVDVVHLGSSDLRQQLQCFIEKRWASAEETRQSLQDAAKKQIDLSGAAYAKFAKFLKSRVK